MPNSAPQAAWYIALKSSLISVLSTAEGLDHDQPTCRLQLRAASPYDQRRTSAHFHVSLSGMSAPHWRRDQQPGVFPARANHFRRLG
jgi:hypothetical protein